MSAAGTPRQQAGVVLGLYRAIMRVHRERLPPPMRDLGDSLVRSEFRSHLRGKTTSGQWQQFMEQWREYLDALQGRAEPTSLARSGELAPEVEEAMSADQRKRIQMLRQELQQVGKDEKAQ